MSTHDVTGRAGELVPAHPEGHAALAHDDPFANPGLPEHTPRHTDVDPKARRRAERQVAGLFALSTLASIGFVAAYVGVPKTRMAKIPVLGKVGLQNLLFGLTLGVGLLFIGVAAVHWARKLMNAHEIVEYRHTLRSPEPEREAAVAVLKQGAADAGIGRRGMLILGSMTGAMAVLIAPLLVLLRDLGPLPRTRLRHTAFADPAHRGIVYDNSGLPVGAADIPFGTLITGRPNGVEDLDALAKAAIILIRIQPDEVHNQRQIDWGYEGIYAFSKICPHVGCPVGLYEQSTHHLLCPCHQSTFDLANGAKVIFGPAPRNLPQLAITVDEKGDLVARGDFAEPVGPSFWERG